MSRLPARFGEPAQEQLFGATEVKGCDTHQRSRAQWPHSRAKRLRQLEHNKALGPLVRVDRDIHGFVAVSEGVGKPIVLEQLDAAQANITFDHGERYRVKRLSISGAVDAHPSFDLESCTVPAAAEKGTVRRETRTAADVQPDTLMRTTIDVTKIVIAEGAHHNKTAGARPYHQSATG